MIGTEVVNVVRLELRDTDGDVALVGIGTLLDDVVVEEEVKDVDENIVEGIAEEVGVEGGDEELREVVPVPVGRKVEVPLVDHQLL